MALARVWTWIGQLFVPLAIAWAVFVRGGLADNAKEGVLISRGYWGLLVSLMVGIALLYVLALYVRQARRDRARILIPPNTMFEDGATRNKIVSWWTAIAFCLVVVSALILFSARYADSRIYQWDEKTALDSGFWSSRLVAHHRGAGGGPYAVSQRMYPDKHIDGVNEYYLYLTDGGLAFLVVGLLSAITFLIISYVKPQDSPRYGR